jgi:hypothetical protein
MTQRARPISFPAYAPDGRILFEEWQGIGERATRAEPPSGSTTAGSTCTG